jgi:hypothetical protein
LPQPLGHVVTLRVQLQRLLQIPRGLLLVAQPEVRLTDGEVSAERVRINLSVEIENCERLIRLVLVEQALADNQ